MKNLGKLIAAGALAVCQALSLAAPNTPSNVGNSGQNPLPATAPATKGNFDFAAYGFGDQINQAKNLVTTTASDVISSAMGFLGVPYKRGGNSVETGLDCSGFVVALYQQVLGLVLPRTAVEQAQATRKIELTELQPGDLVFFNTMRRAFSHVGVYMGDGKFIHSPRAGGQIRVEDMGTQYWKTRFNGARRVESLEQQP